MIEESDRLFERFRQKGDSAALGRVFDATAPKLLELAVHLVGDLATAEDLVQATFVTAIERAATFDATRSLDAWLSGILANHARDLKKAARREIDVSALAERIESTPLEHALQTEWSSALAQALDGVPEPYRVVLILRLQHGMTPTEIAHALQRSPGAVRVQLHRGREMLRKLLPAGILANALFIAEPGRGLAQVKAKIIAEAALAKSSLGVVGIVGGLLMSTKIVVGVAALVLALLAFLFTRGGAPEPVPVTTAAIPSQAAIESSPRVPEEAIPLDAAVGTRRVEESVSQTVNDVRTVKLHGRVFDSDTNAGIAGAEVRLFPPQTARLSEVRRRWHDRLEVYKDGTVTACGWPAIDAVSADEQRADSEVGTNFTNAARLDAQEITVYAPTAPSADAIARAVSDASGEFEIRAPASLGFLLCSADGYARRQRAVDPAKLNRTNADDVSIQIAMRAPKPLAGYVVDEKLHRIERSMRLRFEGHIRKPPLVARDMRTGEMIGQPDSDPQMDAWVVDTKPDGSFECELPARMVYALCVEPDLDVVKQGHLRDGGTTFVDDVWPEPGQVAEPLVIVLQSVTSLFVRDRVSRQPIEDIHLLCTRDSNGFLLRFGRFFAPNGRLRLSGHGAVDSAMYPLEEELSPCACTVWAEGYVPATKKLHDLTRPGVIEFELERGDAPSVAGRVHDGGRALAGARVSIVGPIRDAWSPAAGIPVEMTEANKDGEFRISAPRGRYVLGVVLDRSEEYRVVELPSASSVDIDFAIDTTIVGDVHEVTGLPCSNREVVLRGDDGRQVKLNTNAKGVACFSRLAPGGYSVQTMNAAVRVGSKPDRETRVDLHVGERARAELVITDPSPRFARLVVDDAPSLAGWTAHGHHLGEDGPRVSVEPNGRIPTDIRGIRLLQIIGPDEREWTAFVPSDAPDGFEIRIALDGPAYEGVVTSQTTGRLMPGLQVIARPWEAEDGIGTTAKTDDNGRFRLSGLVAGEYSIFFRRRSSEPWFEVEGMYVHTKTPPSSPPTQLAIALPRRKGSISNGFGARGFDGVPELTLSGTLRKASGPLPRVGGFIGSCFPRDGYTLMLFTALEVSSDGTFETRVPAAPSYHASLRDGSTSIGEFDWNATGTSDFEVHDLELK